MKINLKVLFKIIPIAVALTAQHAFASGLQVSPAALTFDASSPSLSQEIIVANPETVAQTFQVYAEDYPSAITAEPNDFALAPGARKTVTVSINQKKLPGETHTQLDVLALPLSGNKVTVAAGAKIKLSVLYPQPKKRGNYRQIFAAVIILAGALAAMIALYFYRRKKYGKV